MLTARASTYFISDFRALDWKAAFAKLEGLFQLDEGWDGEDAPKPDPELISAATRWLTDKLNNAQADSPPSRILASPDGDIVFQWVTSSSRLQIEFLSPFLAEWSLIGEDIETLHDFIDLTEGMKVGKITISDYFQYDNNYENIESFPIPKTTDEVTWSSANL